MGLLIKSKVRLFEDNQSFKHPGSKNNKQKLVLF
jgi:hypothetical protein